MNEGVSREDINSVPDDFKFGDFLMNLLVLLWLLEMVLILVKYVFKRESNNDS